MRRILSVFLAGLIASCCWASPAWAAAETVEFSDVSAEDWFAPYVDICVADGLMVGVGEGRFDPQGVLSSEECAVLALRLYDLAHGGDGHFSQAPEDWGWAVLALADGQVLAQGYLADNTAWTRVRMDRGDIDRHLAFRLETEEEQAWGREMDYQAAVLSMNGVDCAGELHLSGPSLLYFEPDAELRDSYQAMRALSCPVPGTWYRDAWYYADQKGLRGLLAYGGNYRRGFAQAITQAVGELDAINDIFALPDTAEPAALALCRAGVLTGSDAYGTFRPYDTLTRAEAAAILARVLRPELRVRYALQPLETYADYTLTYLYDTQDDYPLVAERMVAVDGDTLLFLDGTTVHAPEGWTIERLGAEDACVCDSIGTYGVMDIQGQVTPAEWWEARERPGELSIFDLDQPMNGYQSGFRSSGFYNDRGEQVTPTFTWTGVVTTEGQSFVCLDGKVYRIEFAR